MDIDAILEAIDGWDVDNLRLLRERIGTLIKQVEADSE